MNELACSFWHLVRKYGVRRSYLRMHVVSTPAIQHHKTAYLSEWCPTKNRAHALAASDSLQVFKPRHQRLPTVLCPLGSQGTCINQLHQPCPSMMNKSCKAAIGAKTQRLFISSQSSILNRSFLLANSFLAGMCNKNTGCCIAVSCVKPSRPG